MKIKKGDKVQIIKGKDKGKSAKVLNVFPKESKLLVDGLNLYKKTMRPKKEGEKGQILAVPRPVKVDNIQLVCSSCGKPTRTGIKTDANNKKNRYCKKCNAIV